MDKIEANKIAWDKLAKDHYENFINKLEKTPMLLSNAIVKELGDISGKKLIHLQCNVGQDTLSLNNLGAKVTGVDIAPENIKYARKLAEHFQIDARYIESDIMKLADIHKEKYDIVFTSEGAIGWLPDFNVWARTIKGLLKKDGFFYVNDIHPFFLMLNEDEYVKRKTKLKYPYFGRIPDQGETIGGYAATPREAVSYYWMYSISDVVNALIDAGLKIEYIHEFDTLCYKLGDMEKAESGYRFPEHKGLLPLEFSIKATIEN